MNNVILDEYNKFVKQNKDMVTHEGKIIVITGATSLIGSSLVKLCIDICGTVYAIVRKNTARLSNLPKNKNIHVVECDLEEIANLYQLINVKCDIFFHFAWIGVIGTERNNTVLQESNKSCVEKAINVASKLGCSKFVFAGSQAEYGLHDEPLTCNTVENPITPYGQAKLAVTREGRILAKNLGMQFCSGRILSAYGAGDKDNTLISMLIDKCTKGENINLSSCTQIWDYIYAEDVARAFYLVGKNGVDGKAYPIGSGIGRPLKEYVQTIYKIINNKDAKLNFGSVPNSMDSVTFLQADISELTTDTDFIPLVSFNDGIINMINC